MSAPHILIFLTLVRSISTIKPSLASTKAMTTKLTKAMTTKLSLTSTRLIVPKLCLTSTRDTATIINRVPYEAGPICSYIKAAPFDRPKVRNVDTAWFKKDNF